MSCNRCQSTNQTKAGIEIRITGKYQRLKCKDCGHIMTGGVDFGMTEEKSMRQRWQDSEITLGQYRNQLAQKAGFNDRNDYQRQRKHKLGICKPFSENKDCSMFLGVHIAEGDISQTILSKIWKEVIHMPNNNPGFDFLCDKDVKVDVKSACLRNTHGKIKSWQFGIKQNTISDYFLLLAFDNLEDQNPMHVWLIKGNDIVGTRKGVLNKKIGLGISDTPNSLSAYSSYEKTDKLEKTIACCNELKIESLLA